MKYRMAVVLLTLYPGSGVRGDVLRFDEAFSSPQKWYIHDKKSGKFQLDQEEIKVSGAVSTTVPIGEIDGRVVRGGAMIYLPSGQAQGASGSLTLYDKFGRGQLNFTTLLKKTGLPEDCCLVSINDKGECPVKVVWDKWHQMKIELSDYMAKFKIWPEGAAEPSAWQVESFLP